MVLTLPVCPSANRWWRNVNGRMVKSLAARDYQELAGGIAMLCRMERIPAPTEVEVVISWYRAKKQGDLDKRFGVMLDALQGIAYDNDSQIAELHAYRHLDRVNPRMEVIVTELGVPT